MSGLFATLTSAARSLDAQRMGLDVVGQNMANVNTAGYTRRELDLSEVPPYDRMSAGGGVVVDGVRAVRDRLLERRFRQEVPDEQRAKSIADALSVVETSLGKPGESIDAALTKFFDAFSSLAQEPTSAVARQQVILQGESLSASFHDMSNRLVAARRDADASVKGAVDQVNTLTDQIAQLNVAIARATGANLDAQYLKDQQGEAVRKLAEILDVDVLDRQDGGVDVTFGAGHALVVGEVQYDLTATPVAPDGLAEISWQGGVVTGEITSGRMGGLLQVRDSLVPGYQSDLDQIAYTLVQQVNTIHAAGFDLNGAASGTFFDPLGSAAGAASAIGVRSAVSNDPSLIAAAGVAAAGDNHTARALAALRDGRVMSGNTATFSDAWGRILYRAGSDSASAKSDQGTRGEIIRQLQGLRDATSGVSLDEEAMMMLKFQRAYEANARFFTTVDTTIQTLINMVGR